MDHGASSVYRILGDSLRELCVAVGLDSSGPVPDLWRRVAEYLRVDSEMEPETGSMEQSATAGAGAPHPPQDAAQVSSVQGCGSVLVELLRRIPPLTASQPKDVLLLCCKSVLELERECLGFDLRKEGKLWQETRGTGKSKKMAKRKADQEMCEEASGQS
jgi:hypothetical protein